MYPLEVASFSLFLLSILALPAVTFLIFSIIPNKWIAMVVQKVYWNHIFV